MPLFHLKHDNILEFIGLTEHRQLGLGIIIPFMEGGNLMEYMDQLEEKDKTFHHRNKWVNVLSRCSGRAYKLLTSLDRPLAS